MTLVDHRTPRDAKKLPKEAERLLDEIMSDIDAVLSKDARNNAFWRWRRIRTMWLPLPSFETYSVVMLPPGTDFDDLTDAEFDMSLTVVSESVLDEYCGQHLNDVIEAARHELAEDPKSRVTIGSPIPHEATQMYGDRPVQFLVLPFTVTRRAFAH